MKKIKFVFIFICSILVSCGYSPIYTSNVSENFNIQIISTTGNNDINNLLINKLKVYDNEKNNKNFTINLNSTYDKKILSKDKKGDATNYRLVLKVKVNAETNDKKTEFNYKESFNMKKQEEIFEEEKYEKLIIDNMISSIIRKLLNNLSQLK